MSKDQYEVGLKCRTEVLGEAYVEKSLAAADDFSKDLQQLLTEYCWGGTWGRGVLEKRDRSILNLGMLAALNRPHEFKLHFRGALNNGLKLEELREILLQITIYCGAPAGIEGFRLAREVLTELGIDPSNMDSE
jgi:4-carboxymuconolactone decarboxylase